MMECTLFFESAAIALIAAGISFALPHLITEVKQLSHKHEPYWGWEIRPQFVAFVLMISVGCAVGFNLLMRKEIAVVACAGHSKIVVACSK